MSETYPPTIGLNQALFTETHDLASMMGADIAPLDITQATGLALERGRVILGITQEPPTVTLERRHFIRTVGEGVAVDKDATTFTRGEDNVIRGTKKALNHADAGSADDMPGELLSTVDVRDELSVVYRAVHRLVVNDLERLAS